MTEHRPLQTQGAARSALRDAKPLLHFYSAAARAIGA